MCPLRGQSLRRALQLIRSVIRAVRCVGMTVEDFAVLDVAGTDKATGDVILSIADHLEWAPESLDHHATALKHKVESYIEFIRSGQVAAAYPGSVGRRVRVEIVQKHPPNAAGVEFLITLGEAARGAGIELSWYVPDTEESASA